MSRLIRQNSITENTYVEFRFESSLRKYEKKPTKKVKCEAFCNNCISHHRQHSPHTNKMLLSKSKFSRGIDNSLERKSEISVISESKTIKLSVRKPLEQINHNQTALQQKIYDQLNDKLKQQNENSRKGEASQIDQEVYLNDFEPSQNISEENDDIDADFGSIQIVAKAVPKQSEVQEMEINQVEVKVCNQQNQKPNIKIVDQQSFSSQQINGQPCLNLSIPKQQYIQNNPCQDSHQQINQYAIVQQLLLNDQISLAEEEPQSEQQIISKIIIEEQCMDKQMMERCLAFQGGRIYIDSQGQHFYISVRVFNKLRKKYTDIEKLIKMLIQQRPYLESKRQQIKEQLMEYLKCV